MAQPQSKLFGFFKGIQSALFFPFNFVASGVAAFVSQAVHDISVISAKFLKKFAGRELVWDPFYESLDKFFSSFYKGMVKQTFLAGTETIKSASKVVEEKLEHISNSEHKFDTIEKKQPNTRSTAILQQDGTIPKSKITQPIDITQLQNLEQQRSNSNQI